MLLTLTVWTFNCEVITVIWKICKALFATQSMIGAYMHNCTAVPRWFKFSVSVRDINGTLKHTAEVSTKRMEPESGWGLASFCSKHTLTKV